ncbi:MULTISPECIES: acetyl-CoA hydrolase/transferase family protein [Burkholderia]|uniref:Acetyl-CoA hydrolase/transferase family protein n=1 Tax=Burkholderia sola TaxID=2843302 RepID=A0ABV2C6X4_9BURK|nr:MULTISPECIES: acetyl-CoA hydrolase/transferase family protein [unclassified Burkholderia]MBP0606911.1 acetyl-CoA hydrolase/transferase family protein [Burkholderia sp. CpTa8-5]MBP0712222.1 acetyl-CoA hydrolase/transferase family protein [Burkholderia sp. AcTa6-5]RQU95811.1 acetyl-CoA hydrolase/transferase family protein [Burkholderia cenocepacia]
MSSSRILAPALRSLVRTADEAAALIRPGMTVAMSGFTGSGYPKAVPAALAAHIDAAHARGEDFRINVLTGASTAPELDGALARTNGISMRLPYQSDPTLRDKINGGEVDYQDVHLSHVAQYAWFGLYGDLDVAIVEVAGIREDGLLIPSASIGNNKTWLERAKHVILEVNTRQPLGLDGMHDIYYGTALPPHRKPIPLTKSDDRIGEPYLRCPADKIVAIVETDAPDRSNAFSAPDATSKQIALQLIDFLRHEVKRGRLPENLLPLQSGVGNITNAVLAELSSAGFSNLTAYTEVIQDGMLDLLDDGTLSFASATALSLSPAAVQRFADEIATFREKIVLRPQEISNHPELVRRLGCIAMNGMIEADIYGNVNSTHVMGTKIQNGIGGSGDFARNGYLSCFMSASTAKGGAISRIVPMASHVDHTEHDVAVVVTEQGLADLRGLSPKQRARKIIATCAHPDYRPMLEDYFERASRESFGKHTPHLLAEALSWHERYVRTGSMKA